MSLSAPAIDCDDVDSTGSCTLDMPDLQIRKARQVAQFGEFSMDFRTMELSRADRSIGLTLQEFKLLKFLVSRPKIVVSRQKLVGSVWPKRQRSSYRTVDNCIAKLRQKIEDNPDCPVLIQTVHGVGYKFVPQEGLQVFWQSLTE
jgi:DNA-binding response OmpR family regulator